MYNVVSSCFEVFMISHVEGGINSCQEQMAGSVFFFFSSFLVTAAVI